MPRTPKRIKQKRIWYYKKALVEDRIIPSFWDQLVYFYRGIPPFTPSWQESFEMPIAYLITNLVLLFALGNTTASVFEPYGYEIFTRIPNRSVWWLAHCLMAVIAAIEWENIPHVAQILEVIYKNPRIQHARLAEMIDISSATLTGIMKRMTDAGMVEFIRSGKFKYYILTRVGTTYYLQNRTILEQNVILNTKAFEKDRIFAIEEPLHIKVTWINDSTKKHLTSGRKIMRDSGLSSVRIDNENISNYVKCVLGNI